VECFNETVKLSADDDPNLGAKHDEWGTSAFRDWANFHGSGKTYLVPTVDVAEVLHAHVCEQDHVVMNINVEASEFVIFPRLQDTGLLCLLDDLGTYIQHQDSVHARSHARSHGRFHVTYTYKEQLCVEVFTTRRERSSLTDGTCMCVFVGCVCVSVCVYCIRRLIHVYRSIFLRNNGIVGTSQSCRERMQTISRVRLGYQKSLQLTVFTHTRTRACTHAHTHTHKHRYLLASIVSARSRTGKSTGYHRKRPSRPFSVWCKTAHMECSLNHTSAMCAVPHQRGMLRMRQTQTDTDRQTRHMQTGSG